jgi:hypothetical protein
MCSAVRWETVNRPSGKNSMESQSYGDLRIDQALSRIHNFRCQENRELQEQLCVFLSDFEPKIIHISEPKMIINGVNRS